MRRITLDTPQCAFCSKALLGEIYELESGKRLHEPCVEKAVELALTTAYHPGEWMENPPLPNPNKLDGLPIPVAVEQIKEATEGSANGSNGHAKEPEPAPAVSGTDRCAAWIKDYLGDREVASSELWEAAQKEGFTKNVYGNARLKIGVLSRKVGMGGGYATRLPHVPLPDLASKPYVQPEPEPEPVTVAVKPVLLPTVPLLSNEPLTPASYVSCRNALELTDEMVSWLTCRAVTPSQIKEWVRHGEVTALGTPERFTPEQGLRHLRVALREVGSLSAEKLAEIREEARTGAEHTAREDRKVA